MNPRQAGAVPRTASEGNNMWPRGSGPGRHGLPQGVQTALLALAPPNVISCKRLSDFDPHAFVGPRTPQKNAGHTAHSRSSHHCRAAPPRSPLPFPPPLPRGPHHALVPARVQAHELGEDFVNASGHVVEPQQPRRLHHELDSAASRQPIHQRNHVEQRRVGAHAQQRRVARDERGHVDARKHTLQARQPRGQLVGREQ
eukprot:350597-Chlamydomonas_euryale.AAC.5